ncbi:MAG: hypothetical protein HY240_07060 [Actinobacteria bacterium]|nr:hypothetical protein [Actinomycetota bacterium]
MDDTAALAGWHTIPGMSTTVSVGSGRALILTRFTSETACTDPGGGWCSIRILVGTKPAQPYEGTDNAYLNASSTTFYVSTAADRSFGPIGTGKYKVRVQYNTNGNAELWIDDMSFTVQTVAA